MTTTPRDAPKILNAVWFTQMGGELIGIVIIEVPNDGKKAYIGTAAGHNEFEDVCTIAARGAPFPIEVALSLPQQLLLD